MTACCWRLTQPENRRRKKVSGGGNASMGPQPSYEAPTLQAGREPGMVTPLQGGRLVPGGSSPPASVATPAEFSHRTGKGFRKSHPTHNRYGEGQGGNGDTRLLTRPSARALRMAALGGGRLWGVAQAREVRAGLAIPQIAHVPLPLFV